MIDERFWNKVDKRQTGCWLWLGNLDSKGLGRLWCNKSKRAIYARRISYELKFGKIPDKMRLQNRCKIAACINPDHLFYESEAERFWKFVNKKSIDECWDWIGSKCSSGYGNFKTNDGKYSPSHRVAYEITFGKIQNDLHACHKCDRRCCCNPHHIFLGTHTDNMRDKVKKGRDGHSTKKECPHGHEYSGYNLFITTGGHRECRICMNRRSKLYQRKRWKKIYAERKLQRKITKRAKTD